MEQVTLEVTKREEFGSGAAKRLRAKGFLPANMYDRDGGSRLVTLVYKSFVRVAEKALPSQVFVLESEDAQLNGCQVIVKEIQKDFVKNQLLHVDLLKLDDAREVRVIVPIRIVGEAPGVKIQGGVMAATCRTIIVNCRPKNIPSFLTVDISALELGQRVRTGDLQLPEGARLCGNPKETVVSIMTGRAARLASTDVPADGAKKEGAAAATA